MFSSRRYRPCEWMFPTHVLVLVILTGGAFEFFDQVLEIRNEVVASMLAILWLYGAVTKLSELQRGRYVAWHFGSSRRVETPIMIVVGTAPWLMVQLLHDATGPWQMWQSVELPVWARILGALVALVEAAKSNAADGAAAPKRRLLERVRPGSCMLIALLLMISSSAIVGLLAAGQLAVLSMWRLRRYKRRDAVYGTMDSLVGRAPMSAAANIVL